MRWARQDRRTGVVVQRMEGHPAERGLRGHQRRHTRRSRQPGLLHHRVLERLLRRREPADHQLAGGWWWPGTGRPRVVLVLFQQRRGAQLPRQQDSRDDRVVRLGEFGLCHLLCGHIRVGRPLPPARLPAPSTGPCARWSADDTGRCEHRRQDGEPVRQQPPSRLHRCLGRAARHEQPDRLDPNLQQ